MMCCYWWQFSRNWNKSMLIFSFEKRHYKVWILFSQLVNHHHLSRQQSIHQDNINGCRYKCYITPFCFRSWRLHGFFSVECFFAWCTLTHNARFCQGNGRRCKLHDSCGNLAWKLSPGCVGKVCSGHYCMREPQDKIWAECLRTC